MQRFEVHPVSPQARQIARLTEALLAGDLVVFPTETTYALACTLRAKKAIAKIYAVKGLKAEHPLSFLCADLAQASRYAVIENAHYRVLKHKLPGPYTFILPANREAPKNLVPKQKTVGIRIPDDVVAQAVLKASQEPLVATTVSRPHDSDRTPLEEPDEIEDLMAAHVAVMLSRGRLSNIPSSVIDLTQLPPLVIRAGAGDTSWLNA